MPIPPKSALPLIDFLSPALTHRRKFGGGLQQSLAKACGLKKGYRTVIDATAGRGEDAFILAALGCDVVMIERHPDVHAALEQALHAARQSNDPDILAILDRLSLHHGDAKTVIPTLPQADVILLDPMFPERDKSALVKQPLRQLKAWVGADDDADALLPIAKAHARHRVVVKRPKRAPFLNGDTPDMQWLGKSGRWDGYNNPRILPRQE